MMSQELESANIESFCVSVGRALFPTYTADDLINTTLAGRMSGTLPDDRCEFSASLLAYVFGVRDAADYNLWEKALNLKLTRAYRVKGIFKKVWLQLNPLWLLDVCNLEIGSHSLAEGFEKVIRTAYSNSNNEQSLYECVSVDFIQSTNGDEPNAFAAKIVLKVDGNPVMLEFGQWQIVHSKQDKTAARHFSQSDILDASKAYEAAYYAFNNLK